MHGITQKEPSLLCTREGRGIPNFLDVLLYFSASPPYIISLPRNPTVEMSGKHHLSEADLMVNQLESWRYNNLRDFFVITIVLDPLDN